jgi:hypothetical protein
MDLGKKESRIAIITEDGELIRGPRARRSSWPASSGRSGASPFKFSVRRSSSPVALRTVARAQAESQTSSTRP